MARPRALIAVEEERGIMEFARALVGAGYEIIVAGDTGRTLAMAGLDVLPVEFATRLATVMGGRVDALHPSLLAGIVARRGEERDTAALAGRGLPPIDIVVAQVPGRVAHLPTTHGVHEQLAGGPYGMRASLLRLAATNWAGVLSICDPNDYDEVMVAMAGGGVSAARRRGLALKAFRQLGRFDALLLEHVGGQTAVGGRDDAAELDAFRDPTADSDEESSAAPAKIERAAIVQTGGTRGLVAAATGGEQMAAETVGTPPTQRYEDASELLSTRGSYHKLSGGRVSVEALIDVDLGWSLMTDLLEGETASLCRRGHPCAVANVADSTTRAILRALGGDPAAAVGGTVVCSGRIDLPCARALRAHKSGKLLSTIAAAHFDEPAVEALAELGDLRLLQIDAERSGSISHRMHATRFGVLMQQIEGTAPELTAFTVAGDVPLPRELEPAARIAIATARHLGTVGAVIAEPAGTVAICAGQAHVRDAIQIAAAKGRRFTRPCVLALDAPIDHPDALQVLSKTSVKAVIHPGPAPGEADIATAANGAGIALLSINHGWHRT